MSASKHPLHPLIRSNNSHTTTLPNHWCYAALVVGLFTTTFGVGVVTTAIRLIWRAVVWGAGSVYGAFDVFSVSSLLEIVAAVVIVFLSWAIFGLVAYVATLTVVGNGLRISINAIILLLRNSRNATKS